MKNLYLLLILTALVGCTNADDAYRNAFSNSSKVTCYSGGRLIYQGESTSMVQHWTYSSIWYFQERGTNDSMQISGDCIIRTKA